MNLFAAFSSEYEKDGTDLLAAVVRREKASNRTMLESFRLCYVVASPIHMTTIGRHHTKAESRAELDRRKHDPWSNGFEKLLNIESFKPVLPEICDGATKDILKNFSLCLHPRERPASMLKSMWNKLRSCYAVARRNLRELDRATVKYLVIT